MLDLHAHTAGAVPPPIGRIWRSAVALLALLGFLMVGALLISSCGGSAAGPVTSSAGGSAGGGSTGSSTSGPTSGEPVEILVSAAADLSPVLKELTPLFEKESGVKLKINLGSTGQLAQQISAGAGVDVFLAASKSAVDQLAEKGLLVPGSDQPYAEGRLVMWTRPGSSLKVQSVQDLTASDVKRISLANPDHAPYGVAAKQALQSARLWDELQPRLVPAENVQQAFQFAESGNVDVGLVSLSLAIFAGGTYTVVPESLHQPIEQTLAIVASSTRQSQARQFVAFLTSEQGRQVLQKFGFILPGRG